MAEQAEKTIKIDYLRVRQQFWPRSAQGRNMPEGMELSLRLQDVRSQGLDSEFLRA